VKPYRRPWWLLVTKSAGLITTVREESRPGERGFIIRGEPMVRGLAWLIWGPVGALVVIGILTGLAIGYQVNQQSLLVRVLFIGAFLWIPAMAWGIITIIVNRLAAKHLEAERQAEAQECIIRLNHDRGEFFYQITTTTSSATEEKLAFENIQQVKVTKAIGARDGKSLRLTLDTDKGPIVLLDEALGTQAQKTDLAREIQESLNNYAGK